MKELLPSDLGLLVMFFSVHVLFLIGIVAVIVVPIKKVRNVKIPLPCARVKRRR